jgi:hypothetical protein
LSLSAYQKASLQAMDIPLFEHRFSVTGQTEPLNDISRSAGADNAIANNAMANNATESNNSAKNIEAISAVLNSSESAAPELMPSQPVDENHILVQQVLEIFDVKTIGELGISWLTHDEQSVALQDFVLVSLPPDKLNTPNLKKQLWLAVQDLLKAEAWS